MEEFFFQSGGGEKGAARHVKVNKKVLVRDRIRGILDPEDEGSGNEDSSQWGTLEFVRLALRQVYSYFLPSEKIRQGWQILKLLNFSVKVHHFIHPCILIHWRKAADI